MLSYILCNILMIHIQEEPIFNAVELYDHLSAGLLDEPANIRELFPGKLNKEREELFQVESNTVARTRDKQVNYFIGES